MSPHPIRAAQPAPRGPCHPLPQPHPKRMAAPPGTLRELPLGLAGDPGRRPHTTPLPPRPAGPSVAFLSSPLPACPAWGLCTCCAFCAWGHDREARDHDPPMSLRGEVARHLRAHPAPQGDERLAGGDRARLVGLLSRSRPRRGVEGPGSPTTRHGQREGEPRMKVPAPTAGSGDPGARLAHGGARAPATEGEASGEADVPWDPRPLRPRRAAVGKQTQNKDAGELGGSPASRLGPRTREKVTKVTLLGPTGKVNAAPKKSTL